MARSLTPSRNPAVLVAALEKVWALPAAGGGRYRLAYALRLSYESDNETLPLAAADVIASMGVPAETLAQCLVLLSKKSVIDYLADLGTHLSLVAIRKRLSEGSYMACFDDGRTPVRAGRGGGLLVTYAEARYFAGLHGRVRAPATLIDLIEKGSSDDA